MRSMLLLAALGAVAIACVAGDCASERAAKENLLKKGVQLPYVPQCDEEGNYLPQQCHKFGCYCADTLTGESVECEEGEARTCAQERAAKENLVKKGVRLPYVPQCDEEGNYLPRQCHKFGCYCADVLTGKSVECEGGAAITCETERAAKEKLIEKGLRLPYVPQCDENGNYLHRQCNKFSCYCADKLTGKSMECEAGEGSCEIERAQKMHLLQKGVQIPFVPECDEEGNYKPVQCSKFGCHCADRLTGVTVKCEGGASAGKCAQVRDAKLNLVKKGVLLPYVPQCDGEGNYLSRQCGKFGCFCAHVLTGESVECVGGESGDGASARAAKLKLVNRGVRLPYVPQCDEEGNYATRQCTKFGCFCADRLTGKKVECVEKRSAANCMLEREAKLNQASMGIQLPFVPTCDEDGNYEAHQCTKFGCYCAEKYSGSAIKGYSSAVNSNELVTCKCALDKHNYQEKHVIGLFFNCAANGNYAPKQCRGSVCYCVDANGQQTSEESVPIHLASSLNC